MVSHSPELSVVIPSIRPTTLKNCLERVEKYSKGVDYELIIVSAFEPPKMARVRHVPEPYRMGTALATNLGADSAQGKYVLTFADDMLLSPNALGNLVEFMRLHDGELFLSGLRGYCGNFIWHSEGFYGFKAANCPCIRRELIENVGGFFFNTSLHNAFLDHDLVLRMQEIGGKVQVCPTAWFESVSIDDSPKTSTFSISLPKDRKTFFQRWEPVFGHRNPYSFTPQEHFDTSGVLKEPFKGEIPPEYSWHLRKALRDWSWDEILEIIKADESRYCLSEQGLVRFMEKFLACHDQVHSDVWEEVIVWSSQVS